MASEQVKASYFDCSQTQIIFPIFTRFAVQMYLFTSPQCALSTHRATGAVTCCEKNPIPCKNMKICLPLFSVTVCVKDVKDFEYNFLNYFI